MKKDMRLEELFSKVGKKETKTKGPKDLNSLSGRFIYFFCDLS